MAILFVDSVDHYDASGILQKWDAVSTSGGSLSALTIDAGGGRHGGAIKFFNWPGYIQKHFDPTYSTLYFSFAYKWGGVANGTFFEALGPGNVAHFRLRYGTGGSISICRGDNWGIGATAAGQLVNGEYVLIQVKVAFGGGVSWELRVNGAPVSSGTEFQSHLTTHEVEGVPHLDDHYVNYGPIHGFGFAQDLGGLGLTNSWIDDIVVNDESGLYNTGWLHPRYVVTCLRPAANGALQQWFPLGAGALYSQLDETSPGPNEDTDGIWTSAVGDQATFQMSALPYDVAGHVHAVQLVTAARKDQEGDRTLAPVLKNGGSEWVGPDIPLTNTYRCYRTILERNPLDGDERFAAYDLDGPIEIGVKLTG